MSVRVVGVSSPYRTFWTFGALMVVDTGDNFWGECTEPAPGGGYRASWRLLPRYLCTSCGKPVLPQRFGGEGIDVRSCGVKVWRCQGCIRCYLGALRRRSERRGRK